MIIFEFVLGGINLLAGFIMLAAFLGLPPLVVNSGILSIADSLWREGKTIGIEAISLGFIPGAAAFACYRGVRMLLNTHIPETMFLMSVNIQSILGVLSLFSYLWFFNLMVNSTTSYQLTGIGIGVGSNVILVCSAIFEYYRFSKNASRAIETPPTQSSDTTNIQEQIYRNYKAQKDADWHFEPIALHQIHTFHPIPYLPPSDDWYLLKRPWRLVLELNRHGYNEALSVGIDLYGEIILGRMPESKIGQIVLDLSQYGVRKLGISRHHLLLRPSKEWLYAIDLGSKHGVTVNGKRIQPDTPMILQHGDVLSLGKQVTIQVHILNTPGSIFFDK